MKISARIIGSVVALLVGGAIVVELPAVQKKVADKVLDRLNESIDGEISCSSIRLYPLNTLVIKGLTIIDKKPYVEDIYNRGWTPSDTLLRVGRLSATFSVSGLLKKEGIHLGRVQLSDADFHLVTEPLGSLKKTSNLQRVFHLKQKDEDAETVIGPDIFDARSFKADNLRFRLTSYLKEKKEHSGKCINYEDLDARAQLKARRLKFSGSRLTAEVETLSISEKTGYKAELGGDLSVGPGKTEIKELRIKDKWSDVRLPLFSMSYKNSLAFKHFVDEVSFGAKIENTLISYRTIQAFAWQLPNCRLLAEIRNADVEGPVNDLDVRAFDFTDRTSGVMGKINCRIVDVANADARRQRGRTDFSLDAGVSDFRFTKESLTTFLAFFAEKIDFSRLSPGHHYTFNGNCSGKLSRLAVNGRLDSDIGSAATSMLISNIAVKKEPIEIYGTLSAIELNIGKLLGIKVLGSITAESEMHATLKKGAPSLSIESLLCSQLEAAGYCYSGISVDGRLDKKSFKGTIDCNDPNLMLDFNGAVNFPGQSEDKLLDFRAGIRHANLHAINLDRRGEVSNLSLKISSDYAGNNTDGTKGCIRISDIILENDGGTNHIGDINVIMNSKGNEYSLSMNSEFADASFKGGESFGTFISDLQAISIARHLPSLYKDGGESLTFSGGEYEAGIDFHDSRKLLAFAMPGLYIADSTSFRLGIKENGVLDGRIRSPRLAFEKNYIKAADISLNNQEESLNFKILNDELKAAGILLTNGSIQARARADSTSIGINYDSSRGEDNYGELYVNSLIYRSGHDNLGIKIHTLPSRIKTMGHMCEFTESHIELDRDRVAIDTLKALFNGHDVTLSGGISRSRKDSLNIDLNNLDLSAISTLIGNDDAYSGFINGSGSVISPLDSTMKAFIDICIDSLGLSGRSFDQVRMNAGWNNVKKAVEFEINGMDKDNENPELKGLFTPKSKGIDILANMNRFDIVFIQPFLKGKLSDMSGYLNGHAHVYSTPNSLKFTSERTSFENLTTRISYTNVPYTFDGPFNLDDNVITIHDVTMTDRSGGIGLLSGTITLNKDEGAVIDAALQTESLEILDLPDSPNRNIAGKLSARGDIKVSGPLRNLLIEGSAGTVGNGNVRISTGTAIATRENRILTFKEKEKPIDPYETMIAELPAKKKSGNISLKLKTSINNETQASVTLDKATGNGFSAHGSGLVGIDMETGNGKMNLTGDYLIENGKFHFEVPGIVNKDFSIRRGSTIKFNGDVKQSDLDIHAVYNMKTSLSTLLADTTATNRRPVECIINITGKVNNPEIGFNIKVDDLDPGTKTRVDAALNTDDKIQKQFIALLVMGSFLPDEQSGVVNSSNILYSNVSEIMSGQLNNIFQKLGIPLDLGLGYQQTNTGQNMFDVAISTQLFNNRVVVDGTVGNRQYKTSGNTSSVVGDINIEVKLDKTGTIRLRMFSHSADEHTSFIDYSQRNGLGISFQKEFDRLRDIFRQKKKAPDTRQKKFIINE